MEPIKVGAGMPDAQLLFIDEKSDLQTRKVHELMAGKKVALFGVPGAFTPICSLKHVPSILDHGVAMKEKGIDAIYCVSVNDPYAVKTWSDSFQKNTNIMQFLADPAGVFTAAMGMQMDISYLGLGTRSARYGLLVDDLVVKIANVDEGVQFNVSSAENILKAL